MALSVTEFSAKIKQKYPQYSNIDDNTLAQKIVEKHPEYKSQVNFNSQPQQNNDNWWDSLTKPTVTDNSTGRQLNQNETRQFLAQPEVKEEMEARNQNQLNPFGGVGIGVGKGALSTTKNVADLGVKGFNAATGSSVQLPFKEQIDNFVKPKGMDQNVGFAGEQVGEFLLPGGAVSKLATKTGTLAKGFGLGEKAAKYAAGAAGLIGDAAAASGVNAVQEGRAPTTDDFAGNLLLGGATKLGSKVIGGVGKGFMNQLLGASKGERALLEKKGVDVYKSLADDIGVVASKKGMAKKAGQAIQKYTPERTKILQELDKTGKKVNPQELLKRLSPDDVASELDDIIGSTTFTGKKRVLQDIDSEIKYIKKAIGDKPLTPSRVHDLRQMFDRPVNWDKLNPADKATVAVNKVVADNARGILDKISGGKVTEINAKLSPLYEAKKLAQKGEYSKTLGDIISASGGFGSGGVKGAAISLATQRALRHPATQSLLGVTGYKLGSFLNSPTGRRLVLGAANQ